MSTTHSEVAGGVHGVDILYLRVAFDTARVDHVRKHPKSVSSFKMIRLE